VLNRFERLLLALTQYQLATYATFEGDGRNFNLYRAPVSDAPTGRYFFKSQPLENAHQYRYSSPLAQHVIDASRSGDTPELELTFNLGASQRVSRSVNDLVGQSGELTVNVITFFLKAKNDDLSESYMLAEV
jgi:hypothetical protein